MKETETEEVQENANRRSPPPPEKQSETGKPQLEDKQKPANDHHLASGPCYTQRTVGSSIELIFFLVDDFTNFNFLLVFKLFLLVLILIFCNFNFLILLDALDYRSLRSSESNDSLNFVKVTGIAANSCELQLS